MNEKPKCTVSFYEHGILVHGWLDVYVLRPLIVISKKFKYDICNGIIAENFGASMCITNKHAAKKWRKKLNLKMENEND